MAAETDPLESMATSDQKESDQASEEDKISASGLDDRIVDASRQDALKRKDEKWRRMYQVAFETLMSRFVKFSDPEESNDLGELDEELFTEDSDQPSPLGRVLTNGEDSNKVEATQIEVENEDNVNVSYRAALYHYPSGFRLEKTPHFVRSIQDKNPIRIIHARDLAKTSTAAIFETTVMYAVRESDPYNRRKNLRPGAISQPTEVPISQPTEVLANVGSYLTIRSESVLDILRDIIHYYPSLPPHTNEVALQEPFCMLLHYREEIEERRDTLKQAASESSSPGERQSSTAHEHLEYLTDFIRERYADAMSQETVRHRATRAMCTYDWVWLLFRPGSIVYAWDHDHDTLRAYMVEQHDRQVGENTDGNIRPRTLSSTDDVEHLPRPRRLKVVVWMIDFDGTTLGRRQETYEIPAFDGEKEILSLPLFPKEYLKYDKRVHQTLSTEDYLIGRGKMFVEMARKTYKEYNGENLTFPKMTVS